VMRQLRTCVTKGAAQGRDNAQRTNPMSSNGLATEIRSNAGAMKQNLQHHKVSQELGAGKRYNWTYSSENAVIS